MGVEVRIAGPVEAEAIAALINRAFVVEKFFIDGDRIDVAEVRERSRQGWFLTIGSEGALHGCVYVERRGSRAYLGLLSVDPARQGTGLGARLVAAAEDHARAHNLDAMDLNIVNVREELPPFYRKLGYVESGISPFEPEGVTRIPCHFVKMSKVLHEK